MLQETLQKYAQLLVRKGINVQPGQDVMITAELDQPDFVTLCVEECYKAGARKVFLDWSHLPIARVENEFGSLDALKELERWELDKWGWQLDRLPAKLYLESEDPDGLSGIDQEKHAKIYQSRRAAVKPIRDKMENRYQWCIGATPGKAWAKKMYPELDPESGVEQLWYAILNASRALGDPLANWERHNAELRKRYDFLNSLHLKSLCYRSANGTDFTVGLLSDGCFLGGQETTIGANGVTFNPNIPSEEIFTAPQSGAAEGIVYATKPLSWQGALIENFWVKFANGKVVDVGAQRNEPLLRQMIAMDEGASRIGEVALVPFHSPISQSGLLFYNTLFDENASCHIALGFGITNCLKGNETMTQEEIHARGVNDSLIHVDFMIGSEDLSIVGTTEDNQQIVIFDQGDWAETFV